MRVCAAWPFHLNLFLLVMVRYGYHHHLCFVLRADFHDHREKQPSRRCMLIARPFKSSLLQRWSAHLWQNGMAKCGAASWMKGDVARNYMQWNKRGSAGIAIEVGNKINRHARICTKTRFRGPLKTGSSELAMELFFWFFYKSDALLRAWQILR